MYIDVPNFPKGRYIVTGGAGFLGSHLCEALIQFGCKVLAIDSLITGNRANLSQIEKNESFEFWEKDISRDLSVSGDVDGIFHLASPASPIDYAKYPIQTLEVGAIGSQNILEIAREKKCTILVTSTSEVYGDPLVHPQKEDYWGNVNPIGPRGCYDESKRYLEALTMAYHREHKLQTRIIRVFNTYGPRMRLNDGRVVPNFCVQALKNEDLTVYGDGKQTRSFCYVQDLLKGILLGFKTDHSQPINLGNPDEYSILEFAEKIIQFSQSSSKISYQPLPTDDPKVRCPDISKAKALLGWEPKTSLTEGLADTFEYFKSQINRL